ncbi:MAG: PAS-domain containing protein [Pikeienuella sp.]
MDSTDQMLLALLVALILSISAIFLLGDGILRPINARFFSGHPQSRQPTGLAARVERLALISLSSDGTIKADRNARKLLGGDVSDIREFVDKFESERSVLLSELRLLASEGVRFEQTHRTKSGRVLSLLGAPGSPGAVVHLIDDTKLRRQLSNAREETDRFRDEVNTQSAVLSALDVYAMKLDQDGKPTWRSAGLASAPPALENILKDAPQTGDGRQTVIDDDGAEADFRVHWQEMSNQKGLVAAIGLADLKNAENSRQQLANTMSVTLAHLNMALLIFDDARRLVLFNPAATAMFDEQVDWLTRQPHLREVLDRMRDLRMMPEKADYVAWRDEFLEHLSTDLTKEIDEIWHQPNGGTISFAARSHPTGGLAVFVEDISESVDTIRERAAERAVQLVTTDLLEEAIAVLAPDGLTSFANRAFLRLWGIPSINSKFHVSELVQMCRAKCKETPFWDSLQTSVLRHNLRRPTEMKIHRNDGRILFSRMTPSPDGAIIVVFSDITASENIADALRERTEVLEQANEIRSALVGQISHQLRTPLNSINGFGQLLLNDATGPLNQLQRDYAEGVAQASKELAEAVNGMSDLVTVDGDSASLVGEMLNPAELCSGVIRLVSGWTEYRDVRIDTDFTAAAQSFCAHRVRLRQIVFNLLSDAISSSRLKGQVVLSLTGGEQSNDLRLVCTQHDVAKASENSLALSLIRRFVHLHNGEVSVQMPEDGPREVTVILPQALCEHETASRGVAAANGTG